MEPGSHKVRAQLQAKALLSSEAQPRSLPEACAQCPGAAPAGSLLRARPVPAVLMAAPHGDKNRGPHPGDPRGRTCGHPAQAVLRGTSPGTRSASFHTTTQVGRAALKTLCFIRSLPPGHRKAANRMVCTRPRLRDCKTSLTAGACVPGPSGTPGLSGAPGASKSSHRPRPGSEEVGTGQRPGSPSRACRAPQPRLPTSSEACWPGHVSAPG